MGYTFSIMGRTCYATGSSLLRFAFPCCPYEGSDLLCLQGESSHKDCAAKVSGPRLAQTMAIVLFIKTAFTP